MSLTTSRGLKLYPRFKKFQSLQWHAPREACRHWVLSLEELEGLCFENYFRLRPRSYFSADVLIGCFSRSRLYTVFFRQATATEKGSTMTSKLDSNSASYSRVIRDVVLWISKIPYLDVGVHPPNYILFINNSLLLALRHLPRTHPTTLRTRRIWTGPNVKYFETLATESCDQISLGLSSDPFPVPLSRDSGGKIRYVSYFHSRASPELMFPDRKQQYRI